MKFLRSLLSVALVLSHFVSSARDHSVYYSELKALKKAESTKAIFDEDAHGGLSAIQRDITICKNLTAFQRFVRSTFLACDVVMVTPETMPILYAYVDGICKKANIATPSIFITRTDGFFNAFAEKLLASTGGILIGQKLLHDVSDECLEGIVAHEIGHIKHNHSNKMLGFFVLQIIACAKLCQTLEIKPNITLSDIILSDDFEVVKYELRIFGIKVFAIMSALSYVSAFIINKRFEKEADEFAYKANDKGNGLIEFFEILLKKDELREQEFVTIYELLQQNRQNLSTNDYYGLMYCYYMAKAGHRFTEAYKYVYHNTFIGAHPSPEARIAAAREYLATQTA